MNFIKQNEEIIAKYIGILMLVLLVGYTIYELFKEINVTMIILIAILVLFTIYYLIKMSIQSIIYGYFNSGEWKPFQRTDNLKEVTSDHTSLIKKAIINFLIVMLIFCSLLFFLDHYKMLNFASLPMESFIEGLYPFVYYLVIGINLLVFGCFFFIFLNYFFTSHYTNKNVPLNTQIELAYRKVGIRDTYIIFILSLLILSYTVMNPVYSGLGFVFFFITIPIMCSRIYWLLNILWIYPLLLFNPSIFMFIIQIIIFSTPFEIGILVLTIIFSMIVVLWNYQSRIKKEYPKYQSLSQNMKPYLGFNWNFVSESFINEETWTMKELYERTHLRKKWVFWLEYFFANILNRNVKTLLENKQFLWFKVIFNSSNNLFNKTVTSSGTYQWSIELPKNVVETLPTSSISKIEDPEGDVFLTLEQKGDEITNTNPSIWSVFYVSGLIYWNVIPYWFAYNVVVFIVLTKLIEWIAPYNILVFNTIVYGYQWVLVLIFLGFLFMIFMNNMAIWLAWKKYYRLKAQNNKAIFFSIFKQRAILQSINEYTKDEQGNVLTNNYAKGYYPAFNIEIMNEILNKLSPDLYSLYDKKFPINWK